MYYLVCIADKCLRQIIVRLGRANFISGSVEGRECSRDVESAFKRCLTQRLPYQGSNVSAFNVPVFSVEQIVFFLWLTFDLGYLIAFRLRNLLDLTIANSHGARAFGLVIAYLLYAFPVLFPHLLIINICF